MDNSKYLKEFIGNNYDKITTRKFNILAFFFTSMYMYYRKIYLYGVIVFLIQLLLSVFLSKLFYISFIINILCGLFFNKIYIMYANNKINKIVNENGKDAEKTIKKAGETNLLGLVVGIILEIVVFILLITILGIKFLGKVVEENKENNKTEIEMLDEYIPGTFNGMLIYDSYVKISDEFTINVPSIFMNNSSDEQFSYSYETGEDIFNACTFTLSVPKDYTSGDNLISQMQKFYKTDKATSVKKDVINNISWSSFNMTNDIGKTYYYGTTKNNKVYLFEYNVQSKTDSNCENYRSQILNSIKVK